MAAGPDIVLQGGRVIDPATGRDGIADIGITAGHIVAIEPSLPTDAAREVIDVSGKVVTAGMIDTHGHVYQHVTGKFGLNADMVGVQSGVTTVVDQGGPSCMTILGFRNFIAAPAQTRVLCFISTYLVGGLEGHLYPELYGPGQLNVEHTVRAARENADIVRGIPGAVDVRVEQVAGLRYLRVVPDRGKLARYGLGVADINQITETLAVGHATGEVLEGERRFGIVVKTQHDFEGELESIASLPLKSVSGQVVPLGDVADLGFKKGPAQVSRQNQSRRLTVEFNVRGRDLMSVVREAQAKVRDGVVPPPGYRMDWGGQFEHYTEARGRLEIAVPAAVFLILFLLWLAFRSMRTALLIFLNVPFAIVGGVVALWVRGIPFSISAGVGFIALFGVAVLNGLVLVSFARQEEDRGVGHVEAITRAADLRLRPVLMTALVASLGFIPMALSTQPGAEVQRPLATVVIGGLISATLLTLLILPVLYTRFGGRKAASP